MNQLEAKRIADILSSHYGYRNIKVKGGSVPLRSAVTDENYHGNLWACLRRCQSKAVQSKHAMR